MRKTSQYPNIDRINAYLKPILEREEKANEISSEVPKGKLFIGICDLTLTKDKFNFYDNFFQLRKLSNPPGVIHVCRAADSQCSMDYLTVSRYSSSLSAELAISCEYTGAPIDTNTLLGFGWHFIALIKLRGQQNILCPCASSESWDVIAAVPEHSIIFNLLDDTPKRIVVSKTLNSVNDDDIFWIEKYYRSALELRDGENSRRFGLAFNIAYTWNYTDNLRIAFSSLWCALDALFGCRTDRPVTERLIRRICDWLPEYGETYIKNLYNLRSDAVHGRYFDEKDIYNAINETNKILREALIKCIETNTKTLPDWE